jgi:hypothetical protein
VLMSTTIVALAQWRERATHLDGAVANGAPVTIKRLFGVARGLLSGDLEIQCGVSTTDGIPYPGRENQPRFQIVGSGERWRVVELSQDRMPGIPMGDWMSHEEAAAERDRLQGEAIS